MARYKERIKARQLRREKGMSIKEIAKRVGVSKGTVSLWCRDIELAKKQQERLYERMVLLGYKGRQQGAFKNKKQKQERIRRYEKEGVKTLGRLTKRDMLIAGVGLYWGEGAKTQLGRFVFSNSDPEMILFLKRFLVDMLGVKEKDLVFRVLINEIHKPRINTVLRFWRSLLNLPAEQFRSPTFIKVKPKKVYENYDRYYGTLKVSVLKSSGLQYRVLGLIKALKKEAGVAQVVRADVS